MTCFESNPILTGQKKKDSKIIDN